MSPLPDRRIDAWRYDLRTAVLVPCYNEAPTVTKVVRDFLAADPTVVVYVYDNNSTDDTARLARAAGAVVVPEFRQGKGWVVRSMLRDIEADVYVVVDGDDTYRADELLGLRSTLVQQSADMVIGDRLSGTYAAANTRRFHEFGNRLVRFLVNRLFGSDLHDIMTGGRCLSRRFAKTFPVTSTGFEIETEMTVHALDAGFTVVEVPITYSERGEGSHSKLNTFRDGARVLGTLATLFRDYRPMKFFGWMTLTLGVAGIAMFVIPLDEYLTTGYVSRVPTLVVSIALGLGAMLSSVCGLILESVRRHAKRFFELHLISFTTAESGRDPLSS